MVPCRLWQSFFPWAIKFYVESSSGNKDKASRDTVEMKIERIKMTSTKKLNRKKVTSISKLCDQAYCLNHLDY